MKLTAFVCETCKRQSTRRTAQVKYRRKPPRFCSLKCSAKSREQHIPIARRKANKSAYDRAYREAHAEKIKAYKSAYFQANYDPIAARKHRKERAQEHAEYCRQYYADPARKAAKVAYDESRRSSAFGPFHESHRALIALGRAILSAMPNKYERAKARGYYDRNSQQRKRNAQISRW